MKLKKKPAEEAPKKASAVLVADSPTRYVDLDCLVDHDEVPNRPINKEHAETLKESIARDGLDVPVIAWDGGNSENQMKIDGKVYPATFLVAGFHRRKALRDFRKEDPKAYEKAFPQGIPTVVRTGDLKDVLCAQLRENVARENPEAEEVYPFIETLHEEHGMKNAAIAKHIGKSPAWVSEILGIKKTLGEEGEKAAKSGTGIRELREAASKVKKGKKEGKEVDAGEEIEKAKAKSKKKKDKGRKRAEKRFSAKTIYAAYKALPSLKEKKRLEILEGAMEYIVGDSDDLPDELTESE